MPLWGSWRDAGSQTGDLVSAAFNAPAVLELFVAGYPGDTGVQLFLQREDNQSRIPLLIRQDLQPAEYWRAFQWRIPRDTRNVPVRLMAIDAENDNRGWVGVSAPRGLSEAGLLWQQTRSLLLMGGVFLFDFGLLLLPGFAVANLIFSRVPLKATFAMILVLTVSATLGYCAFWAYFFHKLLGKSFSLLIYLISLWMLWRSARRNRASQRVARLIAAPFGYAAMAGTFYLCLLFVFKDPISAGASYTNERFFTQNRPGDNLIPLILAQRTYGHEPLRPFCCGDWLSSDRPPLQSGIFLLERPLHLIGNTDLDYELLATAMQCLWVCGVWCLLRSLRTTEIQIRRTLGLLIFSGFLFYNSVYTWPKLLAAACILFALSIVIDVICRKRGISRIEAITAATCVALMLLAHPGGAFSLSAFALLAVRFRELFPLRRSMIGVGVLLLYTLPWGTYQRLVDPPGNRLLKMHLAGASDPDSRSTWQAIADAYSSHTAGELIRFKWLNLALLLGPEPFDVLGLNVLDVLHKVRNVHDPSENSRIAQREWIWNAVGLLNIGWLGVLFTLFRRFRQKHQPFPIPFAPWLIAAALLNLALWALIIFGPGKTVTTHSSYADILLLSTGLIGFLLALPSWVYPSVLGLQLFNLCVVWVWISPGWLSTAEGIKNLTVQVPELLAAGCFAAFLFWHFVRPWRTEESDR